MYGLGVRMHGWQNNPYVSVRNEGGPTRVQVNEEEDETFKPRPVGFTAKIEEIDNESEG